MMHLSTAEAARQQALCEQDPAARRRESLAEGYNALALTFTEEDVEFAVASVTMASEAWREECSA